MERYNPLAAGHVMQAGSRGVYMITTDGLQHAGAVLDWFEAHGYERVRGELSWVWKASLETLAMSRIYIYTRDDGLHEDRVADAVAGAVEGLRAALDAAGVPGTAHSKGPVLVNSGSGDWDGEAAELIFGEPEGFEQP